MQAQKHAKLDMTRGPIMKLVMLFALPICLGNVLQQLYNTVDTIIIGNFCGTVSLAAVGTSGLPVEMLICIFLGLGTGVSILVAQYVGSEDTVNLKKTVATATSFLFLCTIPISILGLFVGPLILKLIHVPQDAWSYAVSYIRIIFIGTLGNMGYNMNAGILRGIGDSRSSLLFLIISCIVNVVLDLVFVALLGMDVSGAALATTLAMFTSWIFSVIYIKRRYPELEFTLLPRSLDKKILTRIIKIGLPLGLNNSIYSVGHMLMQSLINAQGSVFMAGCSVATKLTGLANVAITSFSAAATTFSGQNYGARILTRLKKGARQIPLFSGLITAIAGLIVTLLCRPILSIFTKDAQVLEMAVLYIRIVLPFTWFYAVLNAIINYINGLGEVKYPTIVNILMLWAVRIPSAYLIAYFIDGKYVMACYPISFLFGMIAMITFYFTRRWKQISTITPAVAASGAAAKV